MSKTICLDPFYVALYVQEVVTHLYSNLLYEVGLYFLDTQWIEWILSFNIHMMALCFTWPPEM